MRTRSSHIALSVSSLLVCFGATSLPAHAGLRGQPAPSFEAKAKIQNEAGNILRGQISTGRPNLFLAVQANAASDFTDLVAKVVGDDTTYAGLVSTLEEALNDASLNSDKRNDILYNLVRVHLLRSQRISHGADRAAPLNAAATTAAKFPTDLDDPTAWELKGDVEVERGQTDKALVAYRQMTNAGASGGEVQYKIGWAYERANRMPLAASAYQSAAVAQATTGEGGPKLRHQIYQGLTRTAMAQGNDPAALAALAKSGKVGNDDAAPFSYELDAARRLLQRGYAREVLAYAKAAVAANPDDLDAAALRDRAAAQARR